MAKTNLIIPELTDQEVARFLLYVRKGRRCWAWTGSCTDRGYGKFKMRRKRFSTHRIAYTIAFGAIPDGLMVLHTCDNPPCCHPGHLFLGDNVDNQQDMLAKGRQNRATGDKHGSRTCPDSFLGRAKITRQIARNIREQYAAGICQKSLARKYRLCCTTIGDICHGDTWKEAGGPLAHNKHGERHTFDVKCQRSCQMEA